jgi:hypothetical protein
MAVIRICRTVSEPEMVWFLIRLAKVTVSLWLPCEDEVAEAVLDEDVLLDALELSTVKDCVEGV